jgi:hypothetical protein
MIDGNKNLDNYGSTFTALRIFGNNGLASNPVNGGIPIAVGAPLTPPALKMDLEMIALVDSDENSINPALDRIGDDALVLFKAYFANDPHIDQRGLGRPNKSGLCDIGAYESEREGSVDPFPPSPAPGSIAFIRMSGIPLTMKYVGQTCSLTALVYYQNGTYSFNEKVNWHSSDPSVAAIDQYGNMYSYRRGETKITVTTERPGASGQPVSDSANLKVENDMMYNMNVLPSIRGRLADFNTGLQSSGVQLYFVDSDPDDLSASSFSTQFQSAYGVKGFQITEITEEHETEFITSATAGSGRGASQLKPSAGMSMKTLASPGGLVPLKYIYNLTAEETNAILGRELKSDDLKNDIVELFDDIRLEFVDENDESSTVIGSGAGGVPVTDAISSGALSYDLTSSLRLQLDVLMGDAEHTGRLPEYMVGNKIVLADNSANENIKGQLSLVTDRSINIGGGNSGEGGGGGCNGGMAPMGLALTAVICAAYARRFRK